MRSGVENLFLQANIDFQNAEKNITIGAFHIAVFLWQRAVEKSLKACFMKVKHIMSVTHSLVYLGEEIGLPKKHFKFLRHLTPQFVITIYPDVAFGLPRDLYDEKTAHEYLEDSKEVLEWVRSQMKE